MSTLVQAQENRTSRSATFADPELEENFVSFCQLVSPVPWKPAEFEAQRRAMLLKVASYVHLPGFDREDAAHEICGAALLEPLDVSAESRLAVPVEGLASGRVEGRGDGKAGAGSKSPFAQLCGARLLTVAEERSVMRRMHYYKFLAAQILSGEAVDEWDLTRAQGLVKAALWHRDLIVRSNMRLVVSIVKKLPVSLMRHDELVSDGVVALLRAVDKFDPSRGYRFCTYATPVVRRQCFQQLQADNADRTCFAQVTAASECVVARDEAEATAQRAHWLAWRKRLPALMGYLTRREQVIIRSRFCLGAHRRVKTLQRLADALKISKERVRQIERSALAKLRRAAELQS